MHVDVSGFRFRLSGLQIKTRNSRMLTLSIVGGFHVKKRKSTRSLKAPSDVKLWIFPPNILANVSIDASECFAVTEKNSSMTTMIIPILVVTVILILCLSRLVAVETTHPTSRQPDGLT